MFSVTNVAEIVGVSPQAIRKAIRCGRIKAKKVGYCWIISETELDKFKTVVRHK